MMERVVGKTKGAVSVIDHRLRDDNTGNTQGYRTFWKTSNASHHGHTRCCPHNPSNFQDCTSCRFWAVSLSDQGQTSLIPYDGNSDPFETQPVVINASTNLYLQVGIQFLENHIWSSGLPLWCAPRGYRVISGKRLVNDSRIKRRDKTSALEVYQSDARLVSTYINTGLAYSAWALFAVTGSRQHQICARSYTSQCLADLRNYLSAEKDRASFQPEKLILRIFRADVLAGHLSSALIHAEFLKRLVLTQNEAGKGDAVFFTHALYQTSNLALALWRRPFFDQKYIEQFYVTYWAPLTDHMPDITDFQKRIVRFTQNGRLQKILGDTAILFHWTDSCLSGRLSIPPENYCALSVRAEYLQVCLSNFVQDQEDMCRLATAPPLIASLNAIICLALTTILSIRFQKHEPMVNGIPASTISPKILNKLKAAYIHLEANMTSLERIQFADAALWIAFVAALVENRFSGVAPHLRPSDRWWWRQLTALITEQGIHTWAQFQRCLVQFPYHHGETPLPRVGWLDEAFELAGVNLSTVQR